MRNLVTATRPLRTAPCLEASDAAAAIGIDPHKPQRDLWRDKTRQAARTGKSPEPEPWTATSACYWHKLLEPLVASVYTKRSGNALRRISLIACHPDHAWMQARVDWEVVGCPDVDLMRYVNVGQPEAGAWLHGLPMHERVNALHLLAVTGKQAVDLAVLLCGQELQIHRVKRDEALIERVMQLQRVFWRCVELQAPLPSEGWHTRQEAMSGDHGPS